MSTRPPGRPARRLYVARNVTRNLVIATHVEVARGMWGRLRGLIGTPPLQSGQGLLLRPCSGIHTWFMGYPIDALFLDAEGRVVAALGPLRPWRMSGIYPKAEAVLEVMAGTLEATGTQVGDSVELMPWEGEEGPEA